MAKERTAWAQEHRDELAKPKPVVTVEEQDDDESPGGKWFNAWLSDRAARGHSTTRNDSGHWRIYIRPIPLAEGVAP